MSVSEPGKIITPWAESGLKNTIPAAANPATGRAGFDQGFSVINMTAKEAGGIPPFGRDFNGIFYEVTSILRYMQAGGRPTFSAEMATAIGGYPVGAVLVSDDGKSVFQNTLDGNTNNPNSVTTGWARPDLQLREALCRIYAEKGFNLVSGSFQRGFTLANASDVALDESSGKAYSGVAGTYPGNTSVSGFIDRSQTAQSEIRVANYVGNVTGDVTELVRLAHAEANRLGIPVTYAGVTSISIQANALISVNTDVDFAMCDFVYIGGVYPDPVWTGQWDTAFVVEDPTRPIVFGTVNPSPANLRAASPFPTKGVFDGPGYARLRCDGFTVTNRNKNGTESYIQTFCVKKGGLAVQPLSVDLSDFASKCSIQYRLDSDSRLTFKNIFIGYRGQNNFRFLHVKRNNTIIDNVYTKDMDGVSAYSTVNALIFHQECSDVTIKNVYGIGCSVINSIGSYVIQQDRVAEITLDNVNEHDGWPAQAAAFVNGLYVNRCKMNRVDAHQSGHNIFVTDCHLLEGSVQYAWGGGTLSVASTQAQRNAVVVNRVDWGGDWFGSIKVDNCVVNNENDTDSRIVRLRVGSPVKAVVGPSSISVTNCSSGEESSPSTDRTLYAIDHSNFTAANIPPLGPLSVLVDNIVTSNYRAVMVEIAWADFENPLPAANSQDVVIGNILASKGLLVNIRSRVASLAPTANCKVAYRISAKQPMMDFTSPAFSLVAVEINGGRVDTLTLDGSPRVVVSDALLQARSGGLKFGGDSNGATGYTVLNNCRISGAWVMSNVGAFSGCLVQGATMPTLPAGVTPNMIFAGWKGTGSFANA